MSAEAELEALIERSARSAEFTFPWGAFATLYPKKAAECVAQWGGAPDGIFIKDGAIEAWPATMGTAQVRSVFDPSQVQASIDGTPITPVTEAKGLDQHHPNCPEPTDNGNDCACEFLRNWDKEMAEADAKPGKIISMVTDPHGELIVLTSKGQLFRQHVTRTQRGPLIIWTWAPIPVPTADNTPPTEEESANGKEGT